MQATSEGQMDSQRGTPNHPTPAFSGCLLHLSQDIVLFTFWHAEQSAFHTMWSSSQCIIENTVYLFMTMYIHKLYAFEKVIFSFTYSCMHLFSDSFVNSFNKHWMLTVTWQLCGEWGKILSHKPLLHNPPNCKLPVIYNLLWLSQTY